MDSITFQILTMTEADAEVVKTELQQIPGVRTVQVHLPTHSVTVTWIAPADVDTFWKRLEALHFTPNLPQEF